MMKRGIMTVIVIFTKHLESSNILLSLILYIINVICRMTKMFFFHDSTIESW